MKKLGMMSLLIIPIGIAINVVCRQVTQMLALPIFLDTIGTVLVGVLTGPIGGMITGLLTNAVRAATVNPVSLYFAPVSGVIGLIAGLASKNNFYSNWIQICIVGLVLALAGVVTATPIAVIAFGGADGSGSSIVTGFFLATGKGIWQSVFSSKIITETVDKILSLIVAIVIIKSVPESTLVKFPLGMNKIQIKKS
ncbi:ECF transporter S component [Marispirochaeta aestuarii]|nr:ECF transporter S component [Marispirochaeta aestuarii]